MAEMGGIPRSEMDRGLLKMAVTSYATVRGITYEEAHMTILDWQADNPHHDDKKRPARAPHFTADDCRRHHIRHRGVSIEY